MQRIRQLANVIRRGDDIPALLTLDEEQGMCPFDDADSDSNPIHGFQVLLQALSRVDSVDLLDYFGFSHLAWSDELWQQLPACSGNLHIILQLIQLLSDLSAMVAVEYAGISPYANPYEALVLEGAKKLDEMVPGEINHFQVRLLSPRRSNLPRCSKAELATLDDMRREFDALIDSAPSFDDEVSYLPYVEAYLLWRNESWPHPSPCAETFEIAVLMHQIASNYVSGPAYSMAQRRVGLTIEAKPHWIQLFSRSNLPELLTKRLSQATGHMNDPNLLSQSKNNLPTCTDAQLRQHLDDLLFASSALVDLLFISGTVGDLIDYFPAQLQWREAIWLNLPPCKPIFEIAWRFSQLTDDFGALLAFQVAGMQAEAQRYEQQIRRDMALLAEIIPAWQLLELPRAAPPVESELPSCPSAEIERIQAVMFQGAALDTETHTMETLDDLIRFTKAHFSLRETGLQEARPCAEVFQLSLVLQQITGDQVMISALLQAGASLDAIPQSDEVRHNSARTWTLIGPFMVQEDKGDVAHEQESDTLPGCAQADYEIIHNEIIPPYQRLLQAGDAIESLEGIHTYSELQIKWRKKFWAQLPLCSAAYDIAWLMHRIAGDLPLIHALQFAGIADEHIPYLAGVKKDLDRFDQWVAKSKD